MDEEPPPNCLYCGRKLSSKLLVSDWHDNNRYEFLICGCGKKNWKTAVEGSGHNFITDSLESMIRNVCDVSCNR